MYAKIQAENSKQENTQKFSTHRAEATLTHAQCVQQAADNKQEQGPTIVIKRFRKKANKKAT